jgi:hypothetical protein
MTLDRVTPSELLPAIRRARIDSLNIYEVSESELALLERGSPDSLFLNFAVFLLSSALSLLVALLTTTITSSRTFTVFVVFTVTGVVGGLFLLLLWLRNRQSTAAVFAQIRRRMPPEGVPAPGQTIINVPPSDATD